MSSSFLFSFLPPFVCPFVPYPELVLSLCKCCLLYRELLGLTNLAENPMQQQQQQRSRSFSVKLVSWKASECQSQCEEGMGKVSDVGKQGSREEGNPRPLVAVNCQINHNCLLNPTSCLPRYPRTWSRKVVGAFNFPPEPVCKIQLWIPAYVPCCNQE